MSEYGGDCPGCVACYARRNMAELPRDRMVDGPTAAACFELAIRESLDKHGLDETCAKTAIWLAHEMHLADHADRALRAVIRAVEHLGLEVEIEGHDHG